MCIPSSRAALGGHDHLVQPFGIGQPTTRQGHAIHCRVLTVDAAAENRRRLTRQHVQNERPERQNVGIDNREIRDPPHMWQVRDPRHRPAS